VGAPERCSDPKGESTKEFLTDGWAALGVSDLRSSICGHGGRIPVILPWARIGLGAHPDSVSALLLDILVTSETAGHVPPLRYG
jgi:hypothetical protein